MADSAETGWGIFDDERVFDQPCKFEMRLGGHSTYCTNPNLPRGRCEYRWTSRAWPRDCSGFEVNPNYAGQWEHKNKPTAALKD